MKKSMNKNEWIDANLKRVTAFGSGNVEFINRKGKPVNYEDELREVIGSLEKLDLARCDNFGGHLLETGELIRDRFNGSYLEYIESSKKLNVFSNIYKTAIKRIYQGIGILVVVYTFLKIIESIFNIDIPVI